MSENDGDEDWQHEGLGVWVTPAASYAIEELQMLREWIKRGDGYNRDDAPDEIARAIQNRIEQLRCLATYK